MARPVSSSAWLLCGLIGLLAFVTPSLGEDFKCYRCEMDSEAKKPSRCDSVQVCSGERPVCGKLEFSAFFHGVMGVRTLKFCYDMRRKDSGRPLEDIDLCDVPHHDFHSVFSLETRSILGTVCKNKHSTWHMSHSCTTSMCNGADQRTKTATSLLLFVTALALWAAW